MSERFLVGITAFNGVETVKEAVRRILKYVPKTVEVEIAIWDNSPIEYEDIKKYVEEFGKENVVRLGNGANLGQTGSKNGLMKYFTEKYPDVKRVILIDQDIHVNFSFYDELQRIVGKYENAGIVTFWEGLNWQTSTEPHPRYPSKDGDVFMIGDVAGSCWYLSVDAFKQVNGFDQKYFFHSYDSDYCQRMQKMTSYRIYLSVKEGYITHQTHYTGRNFSAQRNHMIQKDLQIWNKERELNNYYFVPDIAV